MAARAGKVVSGDFALRKAMEAKEAVLLLIAADVAVNTAKDYKILADRYKIPYFVLSDTKDALGQCIGKGERAAVAVCDSGFAVAIEKKMKL